MKLATADFDYTLPPELIAQKPTEPRDHSKLLVLDRQTGEITHSHFYDLADFLDAGDVVVRNNSKVIPARLFGFKSTGGKVEILLNRLTGQDAQTTTWECLTRPGLKPGQVVSFENSLLTASCVSSEAEQQELTRKIQFSMPFSGLMNELEKIGSTPLPPYIDAAEMKVDEIKEKYQTTYAKFEGSVAAPTAGLHFTEAVEKKLRDKGVEIFEVTLHVGLGTFAPVKSDDISDHKMHEEIFELREDVAAALNSAKAAGRKIVAIGTTTIRVLETCAAEVNKNEKNKNTPQLRPKIGSTSIFIYPPYLFKFVDALITNFHLPKSTLLILISALVSFPNTKHHFLSFAGSVVGRAYITAIAKKYRFFSFGDSMLIK